MKEFNNIVKEICNELDIKLTFLSDGWVMLLEKGEKIKYIESNRFSLNNHAIANIMNDKGLFYDLMISKNFPIIEHKVIFKDTDKKEIVDFFNKNNKEIIVKSNIGMCGKEVFLINNEEILLDTINYLLTSQYSISLCPYYNILHEYRVIVLDNESQLIYGKIRPKIIGDGINNLLTLAKKFNNDYFSKIENQDFDINYVPKLNEEIILNFQFNLSKGAISFIEIENDLKSQIIDLALNVCKNTNIRFASIDIIETSSHELLIMEANSGVTINKFIHQHKDGYEIAYNVYKNAIVKMFEE